MNITPINDISFKSKVGMNFQNAKFFEKNQDELFVALKILFKNGKQDSVLIHDGAEEKLFLLITDETEKISKTLEVKQDPNASYATEQFLKFALEKKHQKPFEMFSDELKVGYFKLLDELNSLHSTILKTYNSFYPDI